MQKKRKSQIILSPKSSTIINLNLEIWAVVWADFSLRLDTLRSSTLTFHILESDNSRSTSAHVQSNYRSWIGRGLSDIIKDQRFKTKAFVN